MKAWHVEVFDEGDDVAPAFKIFRRPVRMVLLKGVLVGRYAGELALHELAVSRRFDQGGRLQGYEQNDFL